MTVDTLISRCRDLGVTLTPGSQGTLRVSPPGRLPEELREELRQRKAEVLMLFSQLAPSRPRSEPAPVRSTRSGTPRGRRRGRTSVEKMANLPFQRRFPLISP